MRPRKNEMQTPNFSLEKLERPDNQRLFEFFEPKVEDILPAKMSDAVAELLYRHHLGFIDERAHVRLNALFIDPPADMTERLKRACDHLGVTGDHAELYGLAADHADMIEQLTVRVNSQAWPIGNLETLKTYLERAQQGDAEALPPVLAYVMHEAVRQGLARQVDP